MRSKILIISLLPYLVFCQITFTYKIFDEGTSTGGRVNGPYRGFPIDMDGDGDIDVVGALSTAFTVVWYENNGSETFTTHTIATNVENVDWVYALDMDGDNDIDIIIPKNSSSSPATRYVVWYENNGSESFTAANIATNSYHISKVFAIDLDGDDDIDVLSVDHNSVDWYENNGSESF